MLALWNVLPVRGFKSLSLRVGSSPLATGETDEQICDQAFDAGNAFDGDGRGTRARLCRTRQRSAAVGFQGQEKEVQRKQHAQLCGVCRRLSRSLCDDL